MDSDSIDISSIILNDIISSDDTSMKWINTGTNGTTVTGASDSYSWNVNSFGPSILPWATTGIDNTFRVQGDSEFAGNISVQGRSLTEFMDSVEQRLNILRPNPELEAEWDQLRELGEQYRALEQQLTEKAQMWAALQRTQPPVDK